MVRTPRVSLQAMFSALSSNASHRIDPRCVPFFIDHKYHCLPHFIIGGVPKAGTTSLYKYLLQHPEVVAAEDKELTFWGNFFSPKRRPSREDVMADYLARFPKIKPSDFQVTGEATPGYLYCTTCPVYILKYVPKVKLIFSLRNPLERAYSEYLNKARRARDTPEMRPELRLRPRPNPERPGGISATSRRYLGDISARWSTAR